MLFQFHSIPIHSAFSRAKTLNKWAWRTPFSFIARFGQSKVRAVGLISSGVIKKRGANRSDAEKQYK